MSSCQTHTDLPLPPCIFSSLNIQMKNNKTSSSKPLPEQGLQCPRCDSTNTKFCYYNNNSSTQPRYFCKSCRRYWTKGGALRTVPFGGGSRRIRKSVKPYSSKLDNFVGGTLKLFQSYNYPDMEFPLGTPTTSSVLSNPSMEQEGLSFTLSSIESLSSINQDLYWKQQQQTLAMLFGGGHGNQIPETSSISSQSLATEGQNNYYYSTNNDLVTEWLFNDNSSYATVDSAVNNCYNNGGIIGGTSNWINGEQAWSV